MGPSATMRTQKTMETADSRRFATEPKILDCLGSIVTILAVAPPPPPPPPPPPIRYQLPVCKNGFRSSALASSTSELLIFLSLTSLSLSSPNQISSDWSSIYSGDYKLHILYIGGGKCVVIIDIRRDVDLHYIQLARGWFVVYSFYFFGDQNSYSLKY